MWWRVDKIPSVAWVATLKIAPTGDTWPAGGSAASLFLLQRLLSAVQTLRHTELCCLHGTESASRARAGPTHTLSSFLASWQFIWNMWLTASTMASTQWETLPAIDCFVYPARCISLFMHQYVPLLYISFPPVDFFEKCCYPSVTNCPALAQFYLGAAAVCNNHFNQQAILVLDHDTLLKYT